MDQKGYEKLEENTNASLNNDRFIDPNLGSLLGF